MRIACVCVNLCPSCPLAAGNEAEISHKPRVQNQNTAQPHPHAPPTSRTIPQPNTPRGHGYFTVSSSTITLRQDLLILYLLFPHISPIPRTRGHIRALLIMAHSRIHVTMIHIFCLGVISQHKNNYFAPDAKAQSIGIQPRASTPK